MTYAQRKAAATTTLEILTNRDEAGKLFASCARRRR
jgi:hypothetical protein